MRPILLHKRKYELIRELNNLRTVVASLDNLDFNSDLVVDATTGLAGLFGIELDEAIELLVNIVGRNIGEMVVNLEVKDQITITIDKYTAVIGKSTMNIIEKLVVKLKASLSKMTGGIINIQSEASDTILIYPSNLMSAFAETSTDTYLDLSESLTATGVVALNEKVQVIVSLYTLEMIILEFSYHLDIESDIDAEFEFLSQDGFIIAINAEHVISSNIELRDSRLIKSNLDEVDNILANVVGYQVYLLNNHDSKTLSTMDSQTLSQLSGYII